jgi:hypothetical protein
MTKPAESPYFKVRICFPGGIMHVLTRTKPTKTQWGPAWDLDVVESPDGDTIGFINWDMVIGLSWRPPVERPEPEAPTPQADYDRPVFTL